MSYITISKPLSVNHLHPLKRRWQRGLAVEHALIVLLIAFRRFNSCLSSVPRSASWRPRRLARCCPCQLLWNLRTSGMCGKPRLPLKNRSQ
jgi:hypothetical protein